MRRAVTENKRAFSVCIVKNYMEDKGNGKAKQVYDTGRQYSRTDG
jgi:hypothetical protein